MREEFLYGETVKDSPQRGYSGQNPCTHFVHVFEDQNGLKRINWDQFGLKSLGFSERSSILLG